MNSQITVTLHNTRTMLGGGDSGLDSGTGSGIGKHRLVEHDVTGDVNTTSGAIKALIAFMHGTITKKHTHPRAKLEFT